MVIFVRSGTGSFTSFTVAAAAGVDCYSAAAASLAAFLAAIFFYWYYNYSAIVI